MNSLPSFSSALLRLKQVYGGTLSLFQWPTPSRDVLIDPLFQQQIIEQILHSDHFVTFPPSMGRRRAFWKWFIQCMEDQGEEVDEQIYSAYVALLPSSQNALTGSAPPTPSYSTRFWKANSKTLYSTTIFESQTTIESGTTGLRTWNASLALADWLITHPEMVEHCNVLELGSGAGFLGLVIAQLQLNYENTTQPQVEDTVNLNSLTLTDGNSEVLNRCRQNFLLSCNNMCKHRRLHFTLLDWSDAFNHAILDNHYSEFNQTLQDAVVIIGADLVYDTSIIPALIAVLNQFFKLKKAEKDHFALLALTVRRKETINTFVQSLTDHPLMVFEEIDTSRPANEFNLEMDNQEWKLFRIQQKL